MRYFPFHNADTASEVRLADDHLYGESGGLFTATLDGVEVGAVLPPEVRDFKDLKPQVGLRNRSRSAADVEALIRTAGSWTRARVPGDLVALMARGDVVSAHTTKIAELIGGRLWASLEQRLAAGADVSLDQWSEGLAKPGDWNVFRRGVRALAQHSLADPPIEAFARLLGTGRSTPASSTRIVVSSNGPRASGPASGFEVGGQRLAEFLLRLAGNLGTVDDWAGAELSRLVNDTVRHPVVYRAARMVSVCAQPEDLPWRW